MFVRSHMLLAAGAVVLASAFASSGARAEDPVKIGLIVPMTGGQASTGKQIDNAVKLYMQQHGDTVAGKKIEVILKDDATLPDNTKRLAQELIVNDKVNVIAGFGITPAALAAAPLATQAKVPEVVMAAGTSIDKGFNRVYVHNFLTTLKPKSLAMAERFPGLIDPAKVKRAYTIDAFDTAVTAVLHGFADSADYWRRASAKPWLASIRVPTLVINARNDPFVPMESLPGQGDASADVLLEQPDEGGHVGFLTGPFPGSVNWLPQRRSRRKARSRKS